MASHDDVVDFANKTFMFVYSTSRLFMLSSDLTSKGKLVERRWCLLRSTDGMGGYANRYFDSYTYNYNYLLYTYKTHQAGYPTIVVEDVDADRNAFLWWRW